MLLEQSFHFYYFLFIYLFIYLEGGVVLIAQLVELKDRAVLGAVVDVCSNPTMDSKIFFQFFPA